MRIIASQVSLRLAVALAAGPGLALVDAAQAVGASVSGTRKGLQLLVEDGLARRSGSRYELADSRGGRALVDLALATLEPEDVLRLVAAGSRAVEFVGAREDQVLIVFRRGADPLDESHAARRIEEALHGSAIRVLFLSHDDARRALKEEPGRREEYLRYRPLLGEAAATFPEAVPTHPRRAIPALSRRRAAALRARYGIASATLFGSSVREDFAPASDVDVAVRFLRPPRLRDLLDLERELEEVFERDVDIVLEDSVKPRLRREIEREGIPLLR